MNTGAAVIAAIVMAAALITWWVIFYRSKIKAYLSLRKLPRRTVATLQSGERAYVVGIARALASTESLVTKRRCILYTLRVDDHGAMTDATAIGEDFEVEDETGRVRVCGNGAYDAELREDHPWISLTQVGTGFGKGVIARELPSNTNARTVEDEGVLVDGMRVAVGGNIERDGEGSLRFVGAAGSPVYVIDVRQHPALDKGA